MGVPAFAGKPASQLATECNAGLTHGVADDLAILPVHRVTHAQPDGFGKRFFGGKAAGEVTPTTLSIGRLALEEHGALLLAQDARNEALALTLCGLFEAPHITKICANANNHGADRRARIAST